MGVRITVFAVHPERLTERAEELGLSKLESATELLLRLRHVAQADSAAVTLISDGHRRWWIGSFLASCRAVAPTPADLSEAERLLARLLRGYEAGLALAAAAGSDRGPHLPWLPAVEDDQRVATFSADEAWLLSSFLRERLDEPFRRFGRPPDPVGVAPEHDGDWDAWVRSAALDLCAPPAVGAALLTFIG